MPNFCDYCRQISDDLRTSWYFRIWAVTWSVCAIVCLVAMAYYANQETQNKDAQGLRLFLVDPVSQNYPDFQLKVPDGANYTITSTSTCSFGGVVLTAAVCLDAQNKPTLGNLSYCQSFIFAGRQTAIVFPGNITTQRIQCSFGTSSTDSNAVIVYAVEGQDTVGTNAGPFTYITATDDAWLFLAQERTNSDGKTYINYARSLAYRTNSFTNGRFTFSLVFSTLQIRVYEGKDWFTGWISAGQLGGFVFLVYCVHTAFMALVGIVFTNDSTFLNGIDRYKEQHSGNANANPELTPVDPPLPSDAAYGAQV